MTGTERRSSVRRAGRLSLEVSKLNGAAKDRVINKPAFNAELDAEKGDAAFLNGVRRRVHEAHWEWTSAGDVTDY